MTDNPWKNAVLDALVVDWAYRDIHETDPRRALQDLIIANNQILLDPLVSSDAAALVEKGRLEERKTLMTEFESLRADNNELRLEKARLNALAGPSGKSLSELELLNDELCEENEELRLANEKFDKRQRWWDDKMFDLETERDTLRADAERYRWLWENGDAGCVEKDGWGGTTLLMGDDLDAAIYAMRAKASAKKG